MKVKELIELLQEIDEEKEIKIEVDSDEDYYTLMDINPDIAFETDKDAFILKTE